jgi:class 3 adenylate cyclase/alpha-beta hydrolase superfamily lysophospholipase
MADIPRTNYARVGNSFVAYQVLGDGPVDLVYTAGWFAHIEAQWDYPALARFLERLASFSRLICFDRRGHGMSDPIDLDNVTLEQWTDDIGAVMDAAGSERAALLGAGEGGPMAILYAATHPDRTSALALVNTSAYMKRTDQAPWGMPQSVIDKIADGVQRAFYDADAADEVLRPLLADTRQVPDLRRMFRFATSPGLAHRLVHASMNHDVRDVLPIVKVPTLVVHRNADRMRRVEHGRYLAAHIAGSRYVELDGIDEHPWTGEQDEIVDEIEEFLTGVRPPRSPDRVLATVLFTDIVGSTEHAIRLGDKKWTDVLNAHDALVGRALAEPRGRKVNPTGDGLVATFDGPARAVRCAQSICSSVRSLGIEVRAGLHTGEVELRGDDIGGIAVHIGQRVSSLAGPGEVLVSRTVTDLVAGSGLEFADRGTHALKGVPGDWQLYAVAR